MPDHGSVVPRRLLATELRRLRHESGRTLEDLQQELLISTSKLSRLETAQGLPQLRDVRDLVRSYGIAGTPLAADMERWVDEARQTPWWRETSSAVPSAWDEYLELEAAASRIRGFLTRYLPSLLQTAEYARALITAVQAPDEEDVAGLVAVRMARQDVIMRATQPTHFECVVDEPALLRCTGGNEIMHAQLGHLAEVAERQPNVSVRVLELHSGPQLAAHDGTFSVFTFDDGRHPDTANPEGVDKYFNDPARVERFIERFEALEDVALDADESIAFIRATADHQYPLDDD